MSRVEDPNRRKALQVFLDTNDQGWTSQATYIDALRENFHSSNGVNVKKTTSSADVVHLNYLNPLGRIVHGKRNRYRHFHRLVASLLSDIPVVATEHGGGHFLGSDVGIYLTSDVLSTVSDLLIRKASLATTARLDAIIAVSSIVRDVLIQAGIPDRKIYVVEHGVSSDFTDSAPTATPEFVLHVSKYSPHKNPAAIREVATQLNAQMVIAGRDWEQKAGKELRAADNVEILGYVSRERLIELYNEAAVFYFPSLYESFGLPILEAAACGTVPVASKYSAARDVCGDYCSLVGPRKVKEHVEVIRTLLGKTDHRETLERQVGEYASKFTWERTASKTAAVYRTLVE